GTVINVRIFSRKGLGKDDRSKIIEEEEVVRLRKDQHDEIRILQEDALRRLKRLLIGKRLAVRLSDDNRKVLLNKGQELTEEDIDQLPMNYWGEIRVESDAVEAELHRIVDSTPQQVKLIKETFESKIEKLRGGDELPPGVIKMVKVFVAIKRKLAVGDKMAGRHGNKGVVAKIVPVEDMPFLEDGTPVDIVLNPLGVPSRMNLGQIFETLLGWAGKKLGTTFATPIFDGATMTDIQRYLTDAGLPEDGRAQLYDGRTGQEFDEKTTVGYIYMLKLSHLVEDKIHARSIGPYSLITQQPLGGKAQFGGQRFGEMEVWALEAYGAAYCLQELLTIKSDDVLGRVKVYEAIVKGENIPEPGIPESFKVLIKEMQSLCLNVEVLSAEGEEIEMKEIDEDIFRTAEELGIDLSRREPSSVEEV
ncbi:MAG TPA: DNA-directed RNA polymerase subunit beta, partial [Candidatus Paceibacterota bacterium]|nr:DNA-directed RNA polymerase subunit beta [Candidatus Paceibacterota bacterium]